MDAQERQQVNPLYWVSIYQIYEWQPKRSGMVPAEQAGVYMRSLDFLLKVANAFFKSYLEKKKRVKSNVNAQ